MEITSTPIENEATGEEEVESAPPLVKKRMDYLQWEEYFMAVAFLSAQRSKDPNSQASRERERKEGGRKERERKTMSERERGRERRREGREERERE